MNGGLTMRASRFVLAAAAGLTLGGFTFAPAHAADLGGDCCADLEERVAELEATTARKGTKKVSLTISGQLNKFILFWDDGDESNVYAGQDSTYSSSRIRFIGNGKISENLIAGYALEFEFLAGASSAASQFNDNGPANSLVPAVRQSYIYLKDKRYGEIRVGQSSTPSDDLTRITVAGYGFFSTGDWDASRGFFLRREGARGSGGLTGATIGNLTGCYAETSTTAFDCPSTRRQIVMYTSPEYFGFTFQSAFGEDDLFDTAVRFKKDWTNWKVAAGIGYAEFHDERENLGAGGATIFEADTSALEGAFSAQHIPTGLYGTVAFNHSEIDDPDAIGAVTGLRRPDGDSLYFEAGIKRKWNEYGPTGFFGTYATTDDQLGGIGCNRPNNFCNGLSTAFNAFLPLNVGLVEVRGAEADRWGVGAVQSFDNAAFDLYILYEQTDIDVDLISSNLGRVDVPLDEIQTVIVGGRILF